MRNFISMFMILALVVATTVAPSVTHAMTHDALKAGQTQASAGGDCHHHGEAKAASGKTAQNDKDSSGQCCDKGMCKCIGGTCHNGLSQILGNGGTPLPALTASKSQFGFVNEFVDSALPERLKRPPKA